MKPYRQIKTHSEILPTPHTVDPSPGTQHVGKQFPPNIDALLPLLDLVHSQCKLSSSSEADLKNEEQKQHGYRDVVIN